MKFIHKHFFKLALFVCLPIYMLATSAAIFVVPFSAMAFDAPGSEKMWVPWIFVATLFGLAFFFVVCDILIVVFALKCKRKALLYSLLLPWPFIILLILFFVLATFLNN